MNEKGTTSLQEFRLALAGLEKQNASSAIPLDEVNYFHGYFVPKL